MAAVLCDTFCVKPCQACSECCKITVKALRPCCESLCRCCNVVCQWFNEVFSEPLSCFLVLALFWMGAVCLGAAFTLSKSFESCSGPMMIWFVVAMLECVVHSVFALYGYTLVRTRDSAVENYFMVLYKLLVYDPWTAVYIVFDVLGAVWSFVGLSWKDQCPDQVSTNALWVASALLLYIVVSYLAAIFNLFSESVNNNPCFCCFCPPFMVCPCCFHQCLKASYERQLGQKPAQVGRKPAHQPRYQPATHQPNQGLIHGYPESQSTQNYQWNPIPPQVSGGVGARNRNQGESPAAQAAGAVGSYLWNKALTRNNGVARV